MQFSDEELKKIINQQPIGSCFPFENGTRNQIIYYLRKVIDDIGDSKVLNAEIQSFGVGYASYIDVFCYKRDGSTINYNKWGSTIKGISLYLCKLAPVAVLGANEKSKLKNNKGGGYCTLSPESVDKLPDGDWNDFIYVLNQKLSKYCIELLRKRYVKQLFGI